MYLKNREENIMEFILKLIITFILIAVIVALVPTGIGIVLAYPIGSLIANVIWGEKY